MSKPLVASVLLQLLSLLGAVGVAGAQSEGGGLAMTVVVTDESGTPLPGVSVRVGGESIEASSPAPAVTDETGRVDFTTLSAGELQVDLQREGFMLLTAYVVLEAGKDPKVAFSSRQRTGTYWAPLQAVFLRSGAEVTPAVASGRVSAKQARKREQQARKREQQREKRLQRANVARVRSTPKPEPSSGEKPSEAEPSEPEVSAVEKSAEVAVTPTPPKAEPARARRRERPRRADRTEPPAPAVAAPSDRRVAESASEPGLLPNPNLRQAGACPECRPGEWSVSSDASIAAMSEPCALQVPALELAMGEAAERIAAELEESFRSYAGALVAADGNDLLRLLKEETAAFVRDRANSPSSSCAVVGAVIPAGARYIGFRFQAGDRSFMGDCFPGQECQVKDGLWLAEPGVLRTESVTLVYGVFDNRSARKERSARLTVYFKPGQGWLPPR